MKSAWLGLVSHQYQLAPPGAQLQERGTHALGPPRGRSPHHFSVDFLNKTALPVQNWKLCNMLPSPNFGGEIRKAPPRSTVTKRGFKFLLHGHTKQVSNDYRYTQVIALKSLCSINIALKSLCSINTLTLAIARQDLPWYGHDMEVCSLFNSMVIQK